MAVFAERVERRMIGGGPQHEHFVHAAERHDAGLDADYRMAPAARASAPMRRSARCRVALKTSLNS